MEGIAEDDLRVDIVEFQRRHRLNRTVGANRHEYRRFDDAMVQGQTTATGVAVGFQKRIFHLTLFFSLVSNIASP